MNNTNEYEILKREELQFDQWDEKEWQWVFRGNNKQLNERGEIRLHQIELINF